MAKVYITLGTEINSYRLHFLLKKQPLHLTIIILSALVCFIWCVCLTKNSDAEAGIGLLVLDPFMDMAHVVSTVSGGGLRKDQAGAHVHRGQHLGQRLNFNQL